jgi:flagellar biosynthesis protein FlhG
MQCAMRRLWVIGGGKGGVGKSFFAASMATILARTGKSVIAVDADLGCPNLHTYLGIKSPACTLLDHLDGHVGSEDLMLPTAQPGLSMISCAPSIPGSANPQFRNKERIIKFIHDLQADCVVVDLGSGTGFTVLDLFNMSGEGVVLSTPDPASMQNVYAFIKAAIFRRIQRRFGSNRLIGETLREFQTGGGDSKSRTMLDFYDTLCTSEPDLAEQVAALVDAFRPLMVINMADSAEDQRVAEIVQTASKKFLNVDIRFCGLVNHDSCIRRATKNMTMFDFEDSKDAVAGQIREAVERLSHANRPPSEQPDVHAPATPIMGLNDGLEIMNNKLHIQTEDLGFTGRCITTQVFCKGRVILTTKSAYPAAITEGNDRSQIVDLMRKQHFNVIRELESKKVRLLHPA